MKNFKLLLATTAILSTTAMVANYVQASAITEDFEVKIKLISSDNGLRKIQDLNFGTIYYEIGGVTVQLSTEGVVSGDAVHYGNQQPAILTTLNTPYATAADLWDITISGAEVLKTSGTNGKICGYVSSWQHTKFNNTINQHAMLGFKIGATFTTPTSDTGIDTTTAVDCSATATATLIYTEGSNSGN